MNVLFVMYLKHVEVCWRILAGYLCNWFKCHSQSNTISQLPMHQILAWFWKEMFKRNV